MDSSETVIKTYINVGLRISTKKKKLYKFVDVNDPSKILIVDGKKSRVLFSLYTVEHPNNDDHHTYYTKSVRWYDTGNDYMHLIDENQCRQDDLSAQAFFENQSQENANRAIERKHKTDIGDYTLNELSEMKFSPSERRAILSLIVQKLGFF